MKTVLRKNDGFTLVEMLIVSAILGLVIGAVYMLYITHMRNAYNQDEVVEVQQNLRIAIDAITKDIKMAGMLIPLTNNPIASGTPLNNYSTSITANTSSPEGRFARITKTKSTIAGFSNFSTSIDSADSVGSFATGDTVRIVRPFNNSQPLSGTLTVSSLNSSAPSMTIAPSGTFGSSVIINSGDVFAKAAGTGTFDTITYSLVTNAANSACPVGHRCLSRSVNGAAPGVIIASNLSALRFSYLYDSAAEDYNPADPNKIRAVRVTITGVTTKKTDPKWVPKSRQITSVIKVRNRRVY